jgi:hypothetical protein
MLSWLQLRFAKKHEAELVTKGRGGAICPLPFSFKNVGRIGERRHRRNPSRAT